MSILPLTLIVVNCKIWTLNSVMLTALFCEMSYDVNVTQGQNLTIAGKYASFFDRDSLRLQFVRLAIVEYNYLVTNKYMLTICSSDDSAFL